MYLEDVEPVLSEGMDFLRDEGTPIGCYVNRYMRVLGCGRRAGGEILRTELVAEPGRARALGRVTPDACQDFWRSDEISVDARPIGQASTLP